jgi:TetR/AcrR family transcriptional regulator
MKHSDKFSALAPEKQQRIIDASIKEFVRSGFSLASTNTIIKNAGISKGALFYYFGSKEQLYMHLISESEKRLFAKMVPVFENMSPDLIVRLREIANVYFDLCIEESDTFSFLMTLTNPENRKLAVKSQQQSENKNQKKLQQMFSGIDVSTLRIDMNGVLTIITWIMTGLKESLFLREDNNTDTANFKKDFMQEFELLLDVLKNGIYQKEK